jgi:hypothetical protein
MNTKLLAVAALGLAGSVGLTAAARRPQPPQPDPGMVGFASCMRARGVAVPDPVPNAQGSFTVDDPPSATPQQIEAHAACDPILQAETPPDKWRSVHTPTNAPPTTR